MFVVISLRVFTPLYTISCVLRLFAEDPCHRFRGAAVTQISSQNGDNPPIGDVTDGIKGNAIVELVSVTPPRSLLSPHGRGSVADSAEDGLATLSWIAAGVCDRGAHFVSLLFGSLLGYLLSQMARLGFTNGAIRSVVLCHILWFHTNYFVVLPYYY